MYDYILEKMADWAELHGFRSKIIGTRIYWQTAYQTAEYNAETDSIEWYNADFFDNLIEFLDSTKV